MQRDFDETLLEAITETLSSFDEKVEKAVYEYLDKINLQKQEIPRKVEAFEEGLNEVLGQDARNALANVLKRLYGTIGIPFEQEEFDKLSFIDHVRRARMQMYERFVGCIRSGLAVLHFENMNDPCLIKLIAANAAATTIMGLDVDKDLGRAILEIYPDLEMNTLVSLAEVTHSGRARKMGKIISEPDSRVAFSILAFPLSSNCVALAFTMADQVGKDKEGFSAKETVSDTDSSEPSEWAQDIPEGRHIWPARPHVKKWSLILGNREHRQKIEAQTYSAPSPFFFRGRFG